MSNKDQTELTRYFDKTYIVNLPERTDRLKEIEEQLQKINLSVDHPKIKVFPAVRPSDSGEFESIGSRGCFLSHLGILKDAKDNGFNRVLILEDDVDFSKNASAQLAESLEFLAQTPWDIFYGGHQLSLPDNASNMIKIAAEMGVVTSHFIAVQSKAIDTFHHELELMLGRKNGDARGGPMHVDGAYSTVRNNYPELITYAANPVIGYQRASKTDIHQNSWFDKLPAIKQAVSFLRKLKNKFTS